MPSEQARILHLSATHSTNYSIFGFYERLQSLWLVLGESVEAARERKRRWEKQRAKYIEIFVSETSKTYLLLKELKSPEERSTFLASLKNEIACSGKYTPGQDDVLNKVYCDVANKGALDERPEWFIPWYELIVDKDNALGRGGYGSVFQAQWLDSDVVVKRLILSESDIHKSSSTWDSMLPSASGMVTSTKTRSETLKMFRREVDIWFGFSHPHVVRLFGACHVGTPFFVCEFATNGTLVEYLKKHSDKLWIKLHEAALGVQYLHARRVVHGDLKGSNIVIGCDKKAKVTDFGLSLIAGDESEWKTSAASHWVAPECFINEDACPTFASDIYSLGMCIIEALRIVDAGGDERKFYLPWGALANNIVKFHVKQGKLPSRPKACTDDQWQLVKRMCAFEPKKRIMISTVVDELARFAHGSQNIGNNITSTAIVKLESVPGVISAAHELLTRLQDLSHEDAVPGRAL
ncbi:unnamed protein product [Phytophthora lilii]|uniref:Unnamed protein product n=1 Tax=Phytophthora lilii TaxID=2077276 RepID=A0A9W6TFP9_9STRA|nr:unnamed protein product [Phytophthora lilii]